MHKFSNSTQFKAFDSLILPKHHHDDQFFKISPANEIVSGKIDTKSKSAIYLWNEINQYWITLRVAEGGSAMHSFKLENTHSGIFAKTSLPDMNAIFIAMICLCSFIFIILFTFLYNKIQPGHFRQVSRPVMTWLRGWRKQDGPRRNLPEAEYNFQ